MWLRDLRSSTAISEFCEPRSKIASCHERPQIALILGENSTIFSSISPFGHSYCRKENIVIRATTFFIWRMFLIAPKTNADARSPRSRKIQTNSTSNREFRFTPRRIHGPNRNWLHWRTRSACSGKRAIASGMSRPVRKCTSQLSPPHASSRPPRNFGQFMLGSTLSRSQLTDASERLWRRYCYTPLQNETIDRN